MDETKYSYGALPALKKGSKAQVQFAQLRTLSRAIIAQIRNDCDEVPIEHVEFAVNRTSTQMSKRLSIRKLT